MKLQKFFSFFSLGWIFVFVNLPLILLLLMSFVQKGVYGGIVWSFTFQNFINVFNIQHFEILTRSLIWAFLAGGICVLLSFFICWRLLHLRSQTRVIFISVLCLPSLINMIIRIYALKSFVGSNGPWPQVLDFLGINYDPMELTANSTLVLIGLVTSYLPWALLPIYGAFDKLNTYFLEAAFDLGANYRQIFSKVLVPLLKIPLLSAFLLVFIPCLGEFAIPDLLGGAKSMNLGHLLIDKFLKSRDWPLGAALSVVFMILILTSYYVQKTKESES